MSIVIADFASNGIWKLVDVAKVKDVVEHIRKSVGVRSNRELAAALGLPISDIENAIAGKSQRAEERVYDAARDLLKLPKGWPADPFIPLEKIGAMTTIKVIGSAAAGDGTFTEAEEFDYSIPAHMVNGIEFGWLVEGQSLMPKVHPGDMLIARPAKEPAYNFLMIVRRPDGQVSAKIVRWVDGRTVLTSTDGRPDEPADVEYIGLVTGWLRPTDGYVGVSRFHGVKYKNLPIFDESID